MNAIVKNPLELFPQELWEIILDETKDSKDILNVLRGLPQLDISINNKKRFWYIGEVLSSVYNLISLKDALNLRLVCKQWQSRVDHFLQNQPCYRAYSEDLHKDNLNFFEYFNPNKKLQSCSLIFRTYRNSVEKLEEIMNHPSTRNPFVFREFAIAVKHGYSNLETIQNRKVISLLRKFGTHPWYLNFTFKSNLFRLQTIFFVNLLQSTPNLKQVQIYLPNPEIEGVNRGKVLDISRNQAELIKLPELPFLETLEISWEGRCPFRFVKTLLTRYGPQIKRLLMSADRWKVEELKSQFPQLTELQLEVCNDSRLSKSRDYRNAAILKELLSSISSPKLVKLQLCFFNKRGVISLHVEEDILQWLKQFPYIKYFEISYAYSENHTEMVSLKENGTSDPFKDKIPSLQTLKLPAGHGLSYNFLRCFPSLRELELEAISSPTVVDLSYPIKLREPIQTGKLYQSNIWQLLPKLRKVLLLAGLNQSVNLEFSREIYEKMKKAGSILHESQLNPFRQDAQEYLNAFDHKGQSENLQ